MGRKVLLIEPNYKNKYPPMGLMKLATYHKQLGDDVTFFKGEFNDFVLEEIYAELFIKLNNNDNAVEWDEYKDLIITYLKLGLEKKLKELQELSADPFVTENLKSYKDYYRKKKYFDSPKWDRICITTLFTFYWTKTIDTINSFKRLCKAQNEVWVGGVAASVVPDEIEKETGIYPVVGLLDQTGMMDDNDIIIDNLPLDYSILHEIDYIYTENNGYYGYMTRGCVNKCPFCAVPTIEPNYNGYISIKNQLEYVKQNFGEKRNLLLLDNNVLASERFNEIVDEIKECGFTKDALYTDPNEYDLAIKGLISGYNDKGYIKHVISLYKNLMGRLSFSNQKETYELLAENKLLSVNTAKKENIMSLDEYIKPHFHKHYIKKPKLRFVDFNQGVDARLINEKNIIKLAELPIRPLRIAFDSWKYSEIYEHAIRLSVQNGIINMSNYLLYNFEDKPVELYKRLEMNINLCEELNVNIYSFPMKYHPIQDPDYFKNRTYIGKYWNRKFIRAIQAILNSTKGKVGRGKSFFLEAFGSDENDFEKLLYMPETLIIYRFYYKGNNTTANWWADFNKLTPQKMAEIKTIIHNNDFKEITKLTSDKEILHILEYYTISRDDAEKELNIKINKDIIE